MDFVAWRSNWNLDDEGVAHLFLALIERVPEFETTAFVLVAIIGVKMIVSAFGFHMDEFVFLVS